MTSTELSRRAQASFAKASPVQFGPILLLVIGAIISTAVSWAVEHCLNHLSPSDLCNLSEEHQHRLRRLVRWACRHVTVSEPTGDIPDVRNSVRSLGLHPKDLFDSHGEEIANAIHKAAAQLTYPEMREIALHYADAVGDGALPEGA